MIEQTNEHLKIELSKLINQHIEITNGLITVVYVKSTSDLRHAKIVVSVLPENLSGTALRELKKHASLFTKALREKTRLRQVPKFFWALDTTEAKAAELDDIFKQIEAERK